MERTAKVLAGWTIAQPKHPPNPEVAKMIDLGKSAALGGAGGGGDDGGVTAVAIKKGADMVPFKISCGEIENVVALYCMRILLWASLGTSDEFNSPLHCSY